MPNLATLGFVDTFALTGSLRSRLGLFPKEGPARVVTVRGPRRGSELEDEDFVNHRETIWPDLNNLIVRARHAAEARIGPLDLGLVSLEMLDPGGIIPWQNDAPSLPYAERWTRTHLALRTNPLTRFYCGPETMHMEIGFINSINMLAPTSAANFGEHPRIHLIVDFRRKETPE